MVTQAEARSRRIERGDWQTPDGLAHAVVARLSRRGVRPAAVLEPTCGVGAFLAAARDRWPQASLHGRDIEDGYVEEARARLPGADISREDFFAADWEGLVRGLPSPLLVLGNPPWVTSATQGRLRSENLPARTNYKRLAGLDARTGRANFDVSEWMLHRLLIALEGRDYGLAILVKSMVARRVLEQCAREGLALRAELVHIDAQAHFRAAVDAVLLVVEPAPAKVTRWPVFEALDASSPSREFGLVDGALTADVEAFLRTRHLEGAEGPIWRSGVKHDCAKVMELEAGAHGLEPACVFPLMKGSDVANHRWPPTKDMLVPQRALGDDPAQLEVRAPRAWAHLCAHGAALDARKSKIYAGRPRFSVFGVGPYTFAPWKVAIAGLYKRLAFTLVPPHEGRPVVFDDTTYFLPFDTEAEARAAHAALCHEDAQAFLRARIFWDDKRPITKRVLGALALDRVGLI